MTPDLDIVVRSPHWLCFGLDQRRMRLHFLEVDEATIEQAAFLDPRHLDASKTVAFPLARVRAALHSTDNAARPAPSRYILHTAFCCSTLLARCMHVPGRTRSLRELPVFSDLARLRLHLGTARSDEWSTVVDVVDRLTTRTFSDVPAINKPSNVFLATAAEFLAARPDNRALLIHMDLPALLLSCLKKQAGSGPWQGMYAALDPAGNYAAGHGVDPATATPLQLACLLWHWQMQLLRGLGSAGLASRIRQVDANAFLESPLRTVRDGFQWFGLDAAVDEQACSAVVQEALQRNAKRNEQAFTPEQRRREQALIATHFADAIARTVAWSDALFGTWQAAYPTAIPQLLGGPVERSFSPPAGSTSP